MDNNISSQDVAISASARSDALFKVLMQEEQATSGVANAFQRNPQTSCGRGGFARRGRSAPKATL